jgi:hypothetical protein
MKTKFRNQKFSSFLILLIFSLTLINCNSDDNPPIDNSTDSLLCKNFLECSDGVNWKYVEVDNNVEIVRVYITLNDDINNPIESWMTLSSFDCYESMRVSDHQFQIIENSKDKFIIKITWLGEDWQQDEFETWTFTKQGDSLKLVQKYFTEEIILNFSITSDSVSNLQICVD